jgi:hypothetical protein
VPLAHRFVIENHDTRTGKVELLNRPNPHRLQATDDHMLSPITPAAHTGRELIIRLLIARPRRKLSAREGLWHGAIVPRSAVAGYGQLA